MHNSHGQGAQETVGALCARPRNVRKDPQKKSLLLEEKVARRSRDGCGEKHYGFAPVFSITNLLLHTTSVKNHRFLTASPQGEAFGMCKNEGTSKNVGALSEHPRADVGIGPYEPLGMSLLRCPQKRTPREGCPYGQGACAFVNVGALSERPRNVR